MSEDEQTKLDRAIGTAAVEAALAAGATQDEAITAGMNAWAATPSGKAAAQRNTEYAALAAPAYTLNEQEALRNARILAKKRGWAAPTMPPGMATACECCPSDQAARLLFCPDTGEGLAMLCLHCYDMAKAVDFNAFTASRLAELLARSSVQGRPCDADPRRDS